MKFYSRAVQLQSKVCEITKNNWHSAQVVVPLVCADLKLPTASLPVRYNCPNDVRPEIFYPEEVKHIKFLHYMKNDQFDRHTIFVDELYFDDFIGKKMKGVNEIFRRRVYQITGGMYPFRERRFWAYPLQKASHVFR